MIPITVHALIRERETERERERERERVMCLPCR